MNLINKMIGFKTKNLYLAQIVYIAPYEKNDRICIRASKFTPGKYVLVRKKSSYKYVDVFTKSKYVLDYDEFFVDDLIPIIYNKARIKYKDAEEILKTNNSVMIKK